MTTATAKKDKVEGKHRHISLMYPFNWDGLENFSYPVDENGIPQINMGKKIGLRYNPITIAQYGLFNLQKYSRNKEEDFLCIVQKSARWLDDNFQNWKGNIGAWVYDFDMDFYGPKAPWISGMAQGQGISLLLRVFQILPEERILEITQRAFQAFLHPISEGGVVSCFPDGSPVFEEFPTAPPSQVLNGHIFALLGIYDFGEFWNDKTAKELFQVAVKGLKKNFFRYDTGYWNLYDLHPTHRLASPMYMKVHVQLLTILAELTGDAFFQKIAINCKNYLTNPICRFRWLMGKSVEKIRLWL
ncbi:MAG: D-glucuronyl C5-epimerase family protein [bacterium]